MFKGIEEVGVKQSWGVISIGSVAVTNKQRVLHVISSLQKRDSNVEFGSSNSVHLRAHVCCRFSLLWRLSGERSRARSVRAFAL